MYCLLIVFAICVGKVMVSVCELLCCCYSEVCCTLVGVSGLLIISELNCPL